VPYSSVNNNLVEDNAMDKPEYSSTLNGQEYLKQWDLWFKEQTAASDALPEGLQVGKIFSTQVADGYAYYEIVRINKKTVRLKWRKELSPDGWNDAVLGQGGSFPKSSIHNIISQADVWKRILEKI
jgi:hypothetical protein